MDESNVDMPITLGLVLHDSAVDEDKYATLTDLDSPGINAKL
jgi:hypothetical protein